MSATHGGGYKIFKWELKGDKIYIKNEDGREHIYSLSETIKIIRWLKINFRKYWFPLANNVELMGKGKEKYGRRKETVEPVFGQIKNCRGFRQFLLRGLEKVQGEWSLMCTTHNILKLYRSGYAIAKA